MEEQMNNEERRTKARRARLGLTEVVLDILVEAGQPLMPNEIGKRAGLNNFRTAEVDGARWAIIKNSCL